MNDAYNLVQSLYESGDLSHDQANPILEALEGRAALLEAAHVAHELLFHYDLMRQENGVDWGPVEMLRQEALDKLWHAITTAQPSLIVPAAPPVGEE